MSVLDSVLSNTVGVVYRGATGNVDPWTLQTLKDQAAADQTRALGPDADPADVQAAIDRAQSEIDTTLKQDNAHPDQTTGIRLPGIGAINLPKIQKLVDGALAVGAIAALIYFGVLYRRTLGRQYAKLRKGR